MSESLAFVYINSDYEDALPVVLYKSNRNSFKRPLNVESVFDYVDAQRIHLESFLHAQQDGWKICVLCGGRSLFVWLTDDL